MQDGLGSSFEGDFGLLGFLDLLFGDGEALFEVGLQFASKVEHIAAILVVFPCIVPYI